MNVYRTHAGPSVTVCVSDEVSPLPLWLLSVRWPVPKSAFTE